MPPAYRCSICGTDWPLTGAYNECPECQEPTGHIGDGKPLSAQEAKSKKLHAEFERFYEDWDAKRAEPV